MVTKNQSLLNLYDYKLDSLKFCYNYLYTARTKPYINKGDIINLKESYMNYNMINIEVVNRIGKTIFLETTIATSELSQDNDMYLYIFSGFVLQPANDYLSFVVVDVPSDNYRHLNLIAGLFHK